MQFLKGAIAAALLGIVAQQAHADPDNFTQVQRGRYLATVGDCAACHTSKDSPGLSGGTLLQTPFGPISVPNITPDDDTGIGRWAEDQFVAAMQTGKTPSGTHLYPAFPYLYYTKVSKQDLADIYAYLRTLPPVRHEVNRNTLPFPFNIRASLIGWNMLFFQPGEFKADPGKSAEFNRGAYLVQGLGHCAECHTAKNFLGADKASANLQGGNLQGWFAPNITGDKRIGVGGWSVDQIVEYLRDGHNDIGAASGPMAEEIINSSSMMTPADLKAIAVYLKESSPDTAAAPQPLAATDAGMKAGQAIYTDNCEACHTAKGVGVDRMFPALATNPAVQQADPTSLIRVISAGAQSAATNAHPTGPIMPAFGWRLNDSQIADVTTYIRNSWGNAAAPVTADQVGSVRKSLTAP